MSDRKKLINERLFGCLLLFLIGLSLCAWNPFAKKEEIKKEILPKEEISPAKEKTNIPSEVDLEQKLLQEKREELNNTEWGIEIFPSSETNNSLEDQDILRFTNGEIVSQGFKDLGYPASRYTVRIRNGKGSWETMQRDEESKTIIFWRGDWENDQMKGLFSIQKEPGQIESYSFQSTNKKNITETVK
jgi:hypothetical protein